MKELKLLSLVLVAGTATMFTACTSESDNSPSAKVSYESVAAAQQVPVTFGTYMGEQANTRSGHAGSIDNDQLQVAGFGVLAYHTDNGTTFVGTPSTGSQPNFMYNQQVTYASSAWTYSPLKYWPNSIGNFTNTGGATTTATTTGVDRLSFFAYAPYVEVKTSEATFGDVTDTTRPAKGITHITANNVGGNPFVTYVFDDEPAYSVDLMYGVAAENTSYGIGTTTGIITADYPFIDMIKVKTDTKIKFAFKHALARVGLLIQGAFDSTTAGSGSNPNTAQTKITVASVVINGTNMYSAGDLNLNGGTWSNTTSMASLTIDSKINPVIKDDTPANLFGSSSTVTGVTTSLIPLVTGSGSTPDYYMFIPSTTGGTDTTIDSIEITYYVTTKDTNLSDGYSRVENIITQTFTTPVPIQKGLSYLFKLNVGMTSVKIEGAVNAWGADTDEVLWMPINAN
jgi:hypothetical protein